MKIGLTVAILVCSAAVSGAQERLADQLRKGIVQEEANQNLEKAIQAYQAIVTQYDRDRQAAATALFRLAECYRKTGKREQAVSAYQRVVREFADVPSLVGPSRQQLVSTYGVPEPGFARSIRPTTSADARTRAMEVAAEQEQVKAYQARIRSAQRDMVAVQERIKAFQAKITIGVAAPDSAEYLQLQQELEEARRRLEVARARDLEMPPERVVTTTVRREVTEESLRATQIEMDALSKRLADMKRRVEVGIMSPQDYQELQAKFEMLQLRYQAQVKEREAGEVAARETRALNERRIKSVEAEIRLIEERITEIQKRIEAGTASRGDPELLQLRRDLLGLQRKLDDLRIAIRR